MIQIGDRLKEERLALGLSQPQLAAVGLVKPNAQSHYESGKRMPKSDYLIEIGKVGIDLLYVVTGKRYQSTLDGLTTVERQIIQLYRLLSVADQEIVVRIASNLERSMFTEKTDPDCPSQKPYAITADVVGRSY